MERHCQFLDEAVDQHALDRASSPPAASCGSGRERCIASIGERATQACMHHIELGRSGTATGGRVAGRLG